MSANTTPRSSAFPRRVRTEDAWTAHRQRLGYPNEFDQWLATKLEEAETALSERCLTKDDVRCFLRVEYMKVSRHLHPAASVTDC